MRERVDLKSPVREYRPPGSVRGAPGNRRPYLDNAEWPASKATQSHLKATYKPSGWEGIATHKPPTCDPQATFMRP